MYNDSEIMKAMHEVLDKDAQMVSYITTLRQRMIKYAEIKIDEWEYEYLRKLIKYWEEN